MAFVVKNGMLKVKILQKISGFFLFGLFSKREKIVFSSLCLFFLGSGIFLFFNFYLPNTEIIPAKGGSHIEGVTGQPRFINPIYANSDIDRSLTQLVFSGLMKYDSQFNIVPDLTERYEVSEDGKKYTFYLKENVFWHDSAAFSAEDVVFTIKTIQNSDYKSPLLANWVGVEVNKINDKVLTFTLKKPYSAFLENATLKIVPKHLWQDISPNNFPLEIYNLKPIGTGPYKIKELKQESPGKIKSISLAGNPLYFGKKPNISEIKFSFFNDEKSLSEAAAARQITGFSPSSNYELGADWQKSYLLLPRYFAVFFNPENSKVLAENQVRIALNYGTDKREIIEGILAKGEFDKRISNSPVMPELYDISQPKDIYGYSVEKAQEILDRAGFKQEEGRRVKTIIKKPAFEFRSELKIGSKGAEVEELQKCLAKFPDIYPEAQVSGSFGEKTKAAVVKFQEKHSEEILKPSNLSKGTGKVGESTREKLNSVCLAKTDEKIPLKFTISTVEQQDLAKVANLLKQQWEKLGAQIEVKTMPASQLAQEVIKPRVYDALLFGEVLGAFPDPFPFWHSSQKRDPGLNLALYENKKADKLLEEARESFNPDVWKEKLSLFQEILLEDAPAVILFSSDYVYFLSKDIKGAATRKIAEPSNRFSDIENWYIKTKRVFK